MKKGLVILCLLVALLSGCATDSPWNKADELPMGFCWSEAGEFYPCSTTVAEEAVSAWDPYAGSGSGPGE